MEFLGAKRTPPEGWFHEPRSEAESALRKRNHAPAGCTHMHTLTHVRAGERAHMRTQTCVPESAHTCTHTCTTTEAKRGHEKHNRTLTPAHTCDCVKIVRAESAPRMRVYMCTFGAHIICTLRVHIRTFGAVYEPRSEAESAPRKRKKQTEP